eukprot:TRINITY_DN25_c3_g1_i3.p1 TRINITY_DN25_c3_g1~~TRINITY_DN25_c3_g1_i3.p1  ORF type:complete len:110 (+),score=33.85 TRINITY_DN25_c3_g1_i3:233-562(+)
MPLFNLNFSGEFENIQSLVADSDVRYFLTLQCSNCGENFQDIYISPEETVEVVKKEVHLMIKCKGCQRKNNTVQIVLNSQNPISGEEGNGTFVTLDCRLVKYEKKDIMK